MYALHVLLTKSLSMRREIRAIYFYFRFCNIWETQFKICLQLKYEITYECRLTINRNRNTLLKKTLPILLYDNKQALMQTPAIYVQKMKNTNRVFSLDVNTRYFNEAYTF